MARLLREHGLTKSRILDVPCGYGRFWPLFRRLDVQPVGVELDRGSMGLGGLGREAAGHAVCADAFLLPFPDDCFDCVFCVRFLHLNHSDSDRARILAELKRVSRRFLLISVYRPTPLHKLARFWNSTPGRVRTISDGQWAALLQKSNLRLLAVHPLHRFFHMQTLIMLGKA